MGQASQDADSSAVRYFLPAVDTAEVQPGAAAASDTNNQPEDLTGADAAQTAATSRRLRMLPMEGHWGEWIISPMAGSDENEGHLEILEEEVEGENEGFKDWLITGYGAEVYYYANYDHLKGGDGAFSGHGGREERNGNIGERRHRRDAEDKLNKLQTRFPNDDDDMFGDIARSGYHSRRDGQVVPRQGREQAEGEGGMDAKSGTAELHKNVGHLGTIEGNSDAKERSVDAEKNVFQTARGGDTSSDPREHHGQEAIEKIEEVDWSTDDDGVGHRVTVSNSRPAAGVLPPSHDQLDKQDGFWAKGRAAEDYDYDGWNQLEQGFLATNLNPESMEQREEFPPTDESEVLLSRRRYRRPDENREGGDEMSSSAWTQSGEDKHVPGAWITDDDFLIHVAHYSRTAKENQRSMPPEAAEPAGLRRQWERERESLGDTDDDVLFNQEVSQLGAARDRVDDLVAVDMPTVPVGKEGRTWESWATEESDGSSPLPSTPRERGQKQTALPEVEADEHLVGWQFNDDFEYSDSRASTTSGGRDGEWRPDITDDWEPEGGPYFLEEDQTLTAAKDGRGRHATTTAEGEEDEEEGGGDDIAFGSMADYYERFAYDRDEIPTEGAAVPQVGAEEEKEAEEEEGHFEPYSEYYSYLAEMKQLLQQEFPGRFSADTLQQQLRPSKRHGVKTSSSVADAEQRKRPFEQQEKQWGRLGGLMKPLAGAFSAGEVGGAMGFLEALLQRQLSDSRDEVASSEEKALGELGEPKT